MDEYHFTGRQSMTKVVVHISMSLDGLITEPNESVENPLGDDPGRLHDWMFGAKSDDDAKVLDEIFATSGAVLIGRRMFDVGEKPWGDPPPFHMPVFVLTHEQRNSIPKKGGTTYHFASGGIADALAQARAAAGKKNVGIWGGAKIVQQYLKAGLVDEMQIHLIPVLLGEGVRLFEHMGRERIELRLTRTIETPGATHLRFAVVRGSA